MLELRITASAAHDMSEIAAYIAEQLGNPTAASDLICDIRKKIKLALEHPYMYPSCEDLLHNDAYRKIVVQNYVVIYRVDEKASFLWLERVFYGRRNYPDLI